MVVMPFAFFYGSSRDPFEGFFYRVKKVQKRLLFMNRSYVVILINHTMIVKHLGLSL